MTDHHTEFEYTSSDLTIEQLTLRGKVSTRSLLNLIGKLLQSQLERLQYDNNTGKYDGGYVAKEDFHYEISQFVSY